MTETSERLEPCPFCRSTKAAVWQVPDDWAVICRDCKARGPLGDGLDERADAIRRWNTRPAPDKATEQLSSDEAGTGRSGELISPVASTGGRRRATLDQPARPEEDRTIGQSSLGQTAPDALREALEKVLADARLFVESFTIDPIDYVQQTYFHRLVNTIGRYDTQTALASPPIASEPPWVRVDDAHPLPDDLKVGDEISSRIEALEGTGGGVRYHVGRFWKYANGRDATAYRRGA